ncbi:acyltransferase family protein [Simiduia agarivorans]|uniref:Heparan-alpha-glucosaminide N-acetyltransferase catalytic domain-containing protein n=1 Tax=Simiduia agarivorans (strain DSM 21679 / JCM 13881 / BCRC 17597 / SA1) TaxID=1117647 RepID=K4KGG3_SIMAS|nr:heparan-alpha-glucosaminide N-acetyltransferase domain-containing protein [Simiduia agarivorans]AFU98076.1 hypothetical protein M5M_04345 [Simiduia agarivorans SA1 = DSM 21679]
MKQRYIALDALRGLTLALMIVVNTPGSWAHVYGPLLHADWMGWTFTDLVFPFFLFIVGASLYFSQKGMASLTRADQLRKIIRRSLLLIVLGVLLEYYPFIVSLHELRLPGVLQRIGLAFGVAALLVVFVPARFNLVCIGAILASYQVLLWLSHEPYSLEHNLVRQVDLWVFGESHLWAGKGLAFDPEGLLSTWPSVATVLAGFETARWLRSGRQLRYLQFGLWGAGGVVLLMTYALALPINKSLWTPGFVLLTAGLACWTLALMLLMEQWRLGAAIQRPLVSLGQNPLFIYVLSWLWVRSYQLFPTQEGTLYETLFGVFAHVLEPKAASLAFALCHLAVLWLIAAYLARRQIFIKL